MRDLDTSTDIDWLVNHVRTPFKVLDDADKLVREVYAGTVDYAPVLKKLLPRIADPAVMVHRGASEIFALIESILSWPTAITVTQNTSGIRASEDNDDCEAWLGVQFDNLDPNDALYKQVYAHMTRSRFGVLRLGRNEYAPPLEPEEGETDKEYNERFDYYNVTYRRNFLEAVDPPAVGFLEEDGEIVIAVIDEQIPIIDLADLREDEDEADEKGEAMDPFGRISARFGSDIRAGDGTAYDAPHANEWLNKTVRRLTVLTREHERVWIDCGIGRDRGGRYNGAPRYREDHGAKRENTYGEVPLILFKATYRPHAPIKERFEGLGAPIAYEYHGWNLSESIRLSLITNPQIYEQMPPDVASDVLDFLTTGGDGDLLSLPKGKPGKAQLSYGQVTDPTHDLYEHLRETSHDFKDAIAENKATILSFSPNPESVNTNTPAAVVLAMIEAGVRRFEFQHAQLTAGKEKIARMIIHDAAYGGSEFYETDDDRIHYRYHAKADRFASKPFTVGDRTVSKSFLRKFPTEAHVDVSIVASSDAQRAARVQHVLALRAQGLASDADVLAADGEADVSKKLEELAAQEQVKVLAPQMTRVDMIDQLTFNAHFLGVEDVQGYIAERLPEIAPDMPPPGNQNGEKMLTGGQTNPPPTSVPRA